MNDLDIDTYGSSRTEDPSEIILQSLVQGNRIS